MARNLSLSLSITVLLLLVTVPGQAAIVNTLRGFSGEEPGWSGGLSGSYAASGGNSEETDLGLEAQLQWRHRQETLRLLGSANRSSSSGIETARAVTGHLRHNHRLTATLSTLAFFQLQENPFQRLKSRSLLGVGLRLDAVRQKGFKVSAGVAHMWEREQTEGWNDHHRSQRLSLFLSLVKDLSAGVNLDGLLFYQPRWSDWQDWRLLGNARVNVELTGTLSLFTGVKVEHDSRPAPQVEESDWQTTTGFSAKF